MRLVETMELMRQKVYLRDEISYTADNVTLVRDTKSSAQQSLRTLTNTLVCAIVKRRPSEVRLGLAAQKKLRRRAFNVGSAPGVAKIIILTKFSLQIQNRTVQSVESVQRRH
jgi:hypothetical protein